MGQALLLSGRPGVGKTTVVQKVLAQAPALAGGFYTEEIREGGRRTGFRLVSIDGLTGTLAGVNISSPYRVGRYRVHVADLDRVGVGALRRAIDDHAVLWLVVDEIGKMELFSAAFRETMLAALDSPKPVLATIMRASHPWGEAIKSRPDVTLIEVTPSDRQGLPEQILHWLQVWLKT